MLESTMCYRYRKTYISIPCAPERAKSFKPPYIYIHHHIWK